MAVSRLPFALRDLVTEVARLFPRAKGDEERDVHMAISVELEAFHLMVREIGNYSATMIATFDVHGRPVRRHRFFGVDIVSASPWNADMAQAPRDRPIRVVDMSSADKLVVTVEWDLNDWRICWTGDCEFFANATHWCDLEALPIVS